VCERDRGRQIERKRERERESERFSPLACGDLPVLQNKVCV